MQLRSGKISEYRAIQSRGFNVKGRAANPDPRNCLISSDSRKVALGADYGVHTHLVTGTEPAASLVNAYGYEQLLTSQNPDHYLLIGYGDDFLYYAPAPLSMRGPRTRAAKPIQHPAFPLPPESDELEIEVEHTGPATNGLETPSREGAMGGSARNYAASVIDESWANDRSWEWLHIVGHALGGNNEFGNLVAGTYDANTQMIPHERLIQEATQYASAASPVKVKYEVTLYPETWVAIDIKMTYAFDTTNGLYTASQTFLAQTDIEFDKLQYDIWLLS